MNFVSRFLTHSSTSTPSIARFHVAEGKKRGDEGRSGDIVNGVPVESREESMYFYVMSSVEKSQSLLGLVLQQYENEVSQWRPGASDLGFLD